MLVFAPLWILTFQLFLDRNIKIFEICEEKKNAFF